MATANGQPERLRPEAPSGTPWPAFAPDRLQEGRTLLRMGIGKPLIARLMLRAEANGTSVEDELLASGEIMESTYYEALAEDLDLDFIATPDAVKVHDVAGLDVQLIEPVMLRLNHPARPPVTVIVPRLGERERTRAMLARFPTLRDSLAATSRSQLRAAAWQAGSQRRVNETVDALFEATPDRSARVVLWGRQGFYIGLLVGGTLAAAIALPMASLLLAHLILSLFYLANLGIRLFALAGNTDRGRPVVADIPKGPRPVYSVLVALYREGAVVRQLVDALDRLDWPRSRLDIKLICEADDDETIAALKALDLGPEYEIVPVPVRFPRTKPKALSYALPGVRGDYVTVYDAEDRPHPGQLSEAYSAFLQAPDDVICLQSPLVVTNARQSWLSALFALEYAALFRGLLPMLSSCRLPLPLGGTSNHFRTRALREIGGWDPYNMTEDADLGLRLYRLGYRARMLSLPTFEDAPLSPGVWLAQRTRWYKGWQQTWLVLMRAPARLRAEMGTKGFVVFQILIAGMLVSSLSHPFVITVLAYLVWVMMQDQAYAASPFALTLFIIDAMNIFGSYAVFIALGRSGMSQQERKAIGWRWAFVPLYWIMLSAAAWRAIAELRNRPFTWNKTPHVPVVIHKIPH